MPRTWLDVTYDVECDRCGKALEVAVDDKSKIYVRPCQDCIDRAIEDATKTDKERE